MKTIVVSGCSRGIGKELVKTLASLPNLFILGLSRNAEKLELLQRELKNSTATFLPFPMEITEKGERLRLHQYLIREGLQVDVLVNNAGFLAARPFEETTEEDFDQMFDVNIKSVFFLVQQLLPLMHRGAHILNISSMGGVQGSVKFPGLAAYSSSKGAVSILTEVLAEELKDRKISVNALALGAVQTEMLQEAFPDYTAPLSAQQMASWIANFILNDYAFFNGKILPVSSTTP